MLARGLKAECRRGAAQVLVVAAGYVEGRPRIAGSKITRTLACQSPQLWSLQVRASCKCCTTSAHPWLRAEGIVSPAVKSRPTAEGRIAVVWTM